LFFARENCMGAGSEGWRLGYCQSHYPNHGQIKIASRKVAKSLRRLYISSRLRVLA
jgi:hypothetical protein